MEDKVGATLSSTSSYLPQSENNSSYRLVRLLFYISKKTKARSERGGQHPVAVQDPPIQRHCSNRDHTHGVRASLAQSGEYAGRVDGKDSGVVDAEMSSLTTDH